VSNDNPGGDGYRGDFVVFVRVFSSQYDGDMLKERGRTSQLVRIDRRQGSVEYDAATQSR
jgi:hypothetical protein